MAPLVACWLGVKLRPGKLYEIFLSTSCIFAYAGFCKWYTGLDGSWTSEYDTPYTANKILCHQLSNLTLTLSNFTIRDLERFKG